MRWTMMYTESSLHIASSQHLQVGQNITHNQNITLRSKQGGIQEFVPGGWSKKSLLEGGGPENLFENKIWQIHLSYFIRLKGL